MDEIARDLENQLNNLLETKDNVIKRNLSDNIWHYNRVVNISKKEKIKHPKTNKAHPCPFPERLSERIIKMSSKKGDFILDIFSFIITCSIYWRRSKRIKKMVRSSSSTKISTCRIN